MPLLAPLVLLGALAQDAEQDPILVLGGAPDLPGSGKHVVLVAGDEEYRSEEALPMLARLLAVRHGFRCTQLFSIDPDSGTIDPENQTHIPGLEALAGADLAVFFLRFRELPEDDMRHVDAYVRSGRPIVGIRTSTHAFDHSRKPDGPYARYSWRGNAEWPGGFGQQVLGETWVAHHGHHGRESTRGVVEPANAGHPILRGVQDVWGPTDVYTVEHLGDDATILLRGAVLDGMTPESEPVEGEKNDPMMPLAWIREVEVAPGKRARVFCSTIGAATDFESEDLRRLFVNACYWGVGLEDRIPEEADVEPVGEYDPSPFGFGRHREGVRPSDHARMPERGK